jgi:hypothetical protein
MKIGELDYQTTNWLNGEVDRLMTREFVGKFPLDEMIDEILASEPFVSCAVEREVPDVALREVAEKRVRFNMSPSVSKWR